MCEQINAVLDLVAQLQRHPPPPSVRDVMAPIAKEDPEVTDGESSSESSKARISSEYKVNSWPTFMVLNQKGSIVEVIEGNADDLVEHLSKVIDNLLANESQGPFR